MVSTNSARKPARTDSVAMRAKTARVMPRSEIQVITETPPSARLARM